jgi:RNA polymerase sigma-70 factor, ECF subfamily
MIVENGPHCAALTQAALLMSKAPDTEAASEILEVASLVHRTVEGDSAAFEQLVIRYERRVFTLALKLLGAMDDAQDATQEVFLRAFKYIHRFDVRKPIRPWLMQMTVNVCRNIGRNRQRRWTTFSDVTADDVPTAAKTGDPHNGFAEQQERQMLWKALNDLPEKERMAVVLRDIEGLSTTEVAHILHSSETTVRSQVSRARVRMKTAIDQMLGGQL